MNKLTKDNISEHVMLEIESVPDKLDMRIIGELSELLTENKDSVVSSINHLQSSVNENLSIIGETIREKGVNINEQPSFDDIALAIGNLGGNDVKVDPTTTATVGPNSYNVKTNDRFWIESSKTSSITKTDVNRRTRLNVTGESFKNAVFVPVGDEGLLVVGTLTDKTNTDLFSVSYYYRKSKSDTYFTKQKYTDSSISLKQAKVCPSSDKDGVIFLTSTKSAGVFVYRYTLSKTGGVKVNLINQVAVSTTISSFDAVNIYLNSYIIQYSTSSSASLLHVSVSLNTVASNNLISLGNMYDPTYCRIVPVSAKRFILLSYGSQQILIRSFKMSSTGIITSLYSNLTLLSRSTMGFDIAPNSWGDNKFCMCYCVSATKLVYVSMITSASTAISSTAVEINGTTQYKDCKILSNPSRVNSFILLLDRYDGKGVDIVTFDMDNGRDVTNVKTVELKTDISLVSSTIFTTNRKMVEIYTSQTDGLVSIDEHDIFIDSPTIANVATSPFIEPDGFILSDGMVGDKVDVIIM